MKHPKNRTLTLNILDFGGALVMKYSLTLFTDKNKSILI